MNNWSYRQFWVQLSWLIMDHISSIDLWPQTNDWYDHCNCLRHARGLSITRALCFPPGESLDYPCDLKWMRVTKKIELQSNNINKFLRVALRLIANIPGGLSIDVISGKHLTLWSRTGSDSQRCDRCDKYGWWDNRCQHTVGEIIGLKSPTILHPLRILLPEPFLP